MKKEKLELNGLQEEMIETMELLPKSEQLKLLSEAYKILEKNFFNDYFSRKTE